MKYEQFPINSESKYSVNTSDTNIETYSPDPLDPHFAGHTDDLIFFEDVRSTDYSFFKEYETLLKGQEYTKAKDTNDANSTTFTYTAGLWNLLFNRIHQTQDFVKSILSSIEKDRPHLNPDEKYDGKIKYSSCVYEYDKRLDLDYSGN